MSEREQFEKWWRASKYCQVVIPEDGWEQIALDAWQARAALSAQPVAWRIDGARPDMLGSAVGFWTSSATEARDYETRDDGWIWRVQPLYAAPPDASAQEPPVFEIGEWTETPLFAAPPDAQEIPSLLARHTNHPDDAAVDRFATAMKIKMAEKRDEGRGGWDDKGQCTGTYLRQLLRGHVAKGDPVDVGNLAMMLWNRGEATQESQCTCGKPRVTFHERGCPMAAQEQRSTDGPQGQDVESVTSRNDHAVRAAQPTVSPCTARAPQVSGDRDNTRGDLTSQCRNADPSTHQEPPASLWKYNALLDFDPPASRQEDALSDFLAKFQRADVVPLPIVRSLAARLAQAERERDYHKKANALAIDGSEAKLHALRAENERLRRWLDSNTTYYNTAESSGPVLAYVSKRIWYHATDDVDSWPFSAAIDRALGGSDGQ